MEIKFEFICIHPVNQTFVRDVYTLHDLMDDIWYSGEIIAKRLFSGFQDKDGKDIYEGDIIELIDETGALVNVTCVYGSAIRQIFENEVEIHGFYFLKEDRKTFPIVNNFAGRHDTETFKIIGDIYTKS